MTVNPADIARVTYEDGRAKTMGQLSSEERDRCCPPWDEMEPAARDTAIANTTHVLGVLRDNGYDIVTKA